MKKILLYLSFFAVAVACVTSCCKEDFVIPGTSPTAKYVFVSCNDADVVSIIDATTLQKVKDLPGDASGINIYEPRNLAVSSDGKLTFVPCRHSNNVLVIDANALTVTQSIEDAGFDEPYALAFTPDNKEVWVVNKKGGGSSSGSVTIINAITKQVELTIDDDNLSSPEGICVANGKAYVANRGDGTVTVFNVSSRSFVTNINVGGEPRYAVTSKNGDFVYVTSVWGGLAKINTSVDTISATIDAFGRNAAMSPDGKKLFVASHSKVVHVVNTADDQVTDISIPDASAIYAVAIMSDGSKGFATDENLDVVYVFDPATGKLLNNGTGIPVEATPRAIAAQ